MNREGGVDAASGEKVVAHRQSRAFGGDEDDIEVALGYDARVLLEDNSEAVREVECVAGLELGLHHRPHLDLSGIREQVLENRSSCGSFLDFKERFALNPAVGQRLVPTASSAHSEDHLEALIAHVQPLSSSLRSVTENRRHFLVKDALAALYRIIRALDNDFRMAGDVDLLHRIAP
jgi:hypothetical protein